jgi:hypothetical protein
VQYASGSAEALWQGVETRLHAAIRAAEAGALHRSADHLTALKDGIALHLVRTVHFRRIHESSFAEAIRGVRDELLTEKAHVLTAAFRQRTGLEPAGVEALEYLLDTYFGKWLEFERNGALLRISLELNFERVRAALDELTLEVLHTPPGVELVISDAPAFTFSKSPDGSFVLMEAIGDSHGIGMPISRHCFVAISPDKKDLEIGVDMVKRLNRIQVLLAERQIYYRPGSGIGRFIDAEATLVQPRTLQVGV